MSEFVLNDVDRAECHQPHLHQTKSDHIDEPNASIDNLNCHQSSIFTLPKEFEKSSLKYLYHLTGVVVHHGRGFQSGHYTSYCLNDNPGWFISSTTFRLLFNFNIFSLSTRP